MMRTSLVVMASLVVCGAAMAAAPAEDAWFAPYQTVAEYRPKGPSHCYRQFNIDWDWVGRRLDELPGFPQPSRPGGAGRVLQARSTSTARS